MAGRTPRAPIECDRELGAFRVGTFPTPTLNVRCGLASLLPVLFLLLSTSGCSSSTTQLDSMQAQLSDIQHQILLVKRDAAAKSDIEALEANLADERGQVLRAEADLQVQISSLAEQVVALQAEIGDSLYRLEQISQQINETNQELQTLRRPAPPPIDTREGREPITDPQELYQTAYEDYLRGNYEVAISAFRSFSERFSDTEEADNALYWIGESYFDLGRYEEAIQEFSRVISVYPRSEKVASSILKRGFAYIELGRRAEGLSEFQRVLRDYPSSEEAILARNRLDQLQRG